MRFRKRTYPFLLERVSALTRFSSGARKRTYGFLRKEKRRARSAGMGALSREATTFEKELHFVQIFPKSHHTLDLLLVIHSSTHSRISYFFGTKHKAL